MKEQAQAPALPPNVTDLTNRLRRSFPNASALPIGQQSLTLLLRDAIIMVEVRGVVTPHSVHIDDGRAVVAEVFGRLSTSEQFRLHNALMGNLGYVPSWVQDLRR